MSEEQLNIKYLKERLKDYSYSDEFLKEILKLCSERYIEGLRQGKVDRLIIEQENQTLRDEIKKLEKKIKINALTNNLIKRLTKRNHELHKKWKIQERLNLCLIREEDNAHQRNIEAVKYLDKKLKKKRPYNDVLKYIRKILTMYETANIFDEINKESK